MNITFCPYKYIDNQEHIICPSCRCKRCHKHGSYIRKGFHSTNKSTIMMNVQRYRCLNPLCRQCTFSVLPPLVLRYCRFCWPSLLEVKKSLAAKLTPYHVSRYVWNVSRGVILRAAALLDRLASWIEVLHREVTNGSPAREFRLMVKIVTVKLGRIALTYRWYWHRFPLRFKTQNRNPHKLAVVSRD